MTAAQAAEQIISDAAIDGVDGVYTVNMPQEAKEATDVTVILITDAGTTPDALGNNDFHAVDQEVEVQIWYADDYALDPDVTETTIMKSFVHANWQISAVRQRTTDPDSKQLSNTFYFTHTKILKEG